MKQNLYKMLLAIAIIVTAQSSFAQGSYKLNQVIVLNQGAYGSPLGVTVGAYDPTTKIYQDFDTITNAAFGSDVIIDSGYIYVAADSLLIKYDLNTKLKVATQIVYGIREIAVWGNQLLVTRGYETALPSYFQVYDKNTLNLIYQLSSVSAATEGIKVLNDTAYVAVNNFGYSNVGKLAVIDLKNQIENREIDLGPTGINPYNVEVDNTSHTLYTVNSLNYDSTSVTSYLPATGKVGTTVVNESSSCNGSTYYLGSIWFQLASKTDIAAFSTTKLSVWDSLKINESLDGMLVDSADGYMYVGNTDYATYGKVFIYNLFGQKIDTFNADVTPSNFAFDISSTSGINQIASFANLELYPNPTTNQLHVALIDSKDMQATLTLTDILGRQVYQEKIATNAAQVVPMNSITAGMYFLTVETANGQMTRKIVKE